MALMRRTRVFRAVGWLVCWVMEISGIDDVDQAALDAHIAALAEQDREAGARPGRAGRTAREPAALLLRWHRATSAQADHNQHTGYLNRRVGASPAVARAGPPRTTGFADNGWTTDGYTAPQPAPPRKRADRPPAARPYCWQRSPARAGRAWSW